MEERLLQPQRSRLVPVCDLNACFLLWKCTKGKLDSSALHVMVRPYRSSGAPETAEPKAALALFPAHPLAAVLLPLLLCPDDFRTGLISQPTWHCRCTSHYSSRSEGRRRSAAPRRSCPGQAVTLVRRYKQSLKPQRGWQKLRR